MIKNPQITTVLSNTSANSSQEGGPPSAQGVHQVCATSTGLDLKSGRIDSGQNSPSASVKSKEITTQTKQIILSSTSSNPSTDTKSSQNKCTPANQEFHPFKNARVVLGGIENVKMLRTKLYF